MFNVTKEVIEWCGQKLTIETGRIARQADGAVLITYGETSVLCTVVGARKPSENINFLPLTVHYKEMTSAAGKIPGGFFKREGKPSEKEVLTSRLIDRTLRPLFSNGFFNEVQVICSVMSFDGVNDPDVVATIGASAALMIAGIPFEGPIAAIRAGFIENELVFNPSMQNYSSSEMDLIISGTKNSILMVEAGANELSEEIMLDAISKGHETIQPVIKMIESLKKNIGKELWEYEKAEECKKLTKNISDIASKLINNAYKETQKLKRNEQIEEAKNLVLEQLDLEQYTESQALIIFKKLQEKILRDNISKNMRIDGRSPKDIRDIETEVSILHRTHGSALFTRGETQAIVTTTLGSAQDEQIIDSLSGDRKERFMLHYNFPPYSVGEVSVLRAPGRREIGHGRLAWKAIYPVLPNKEEFSYTIRAVSEITACNGSSSMATVCGTSLALMDAGVPIKKPVAGIAMGLVQEKEKNIILSDILSDEDSLGDMDFKVAGTKDGITALQMDIKIAGIDHKTMKEALDQAKEGRIHILEKMSSSLISSRDGVNKYAPSIISINVPKDKIGEIIGPSGKNIKAICEKTGAQIDIKDDGVVAVAAPDKSSADSAIEMINGIISEAKIGGIYEGNVSKILDFGAIISFMSNKEGLLHISEISEDRINQVSDVLEENQKITVKVIGIDDRRRKLKLSMKRVNESKEEEDARNQEERKNKPKFSRNDSDKRKFRKDKDRTSSDNKSKSESKSKDSEKKQEKGWKKYFNF